MNHDHERDIRLLSKGDPDPFTIYSLILSGLSVALATVFYVGPRIRENLEANQEQREAKTELLTALQVVHLQVIHLENYITRIVQMSQFYSQDDIIKNQTFQYGSVRLMLNEKEFKRYRKILDGTLNSISTIAANIDKIKANVVLAGVGVSEDLLDQARLIEAKINVVIKEPLDYYGVISRTADLCSDVKNMLHVFEKSIWEDEE